MNPRTTLPFRIRFNKYILLRCIYLKWILWIGIIILYMMSLYTHLLKDGDDGGRGSWRTSSTSSLLTIQSENMWNDQSGLKSNKITSTNTRIESIHILGERNSGTTWMYEYVIQLFRNNFVSISFCVFYLISYPQLYGFI